METMRRRRSRKDPGMKTTAETGTKKIVGHRKDGAAPLSQSSWIPLFATAVLSFVLGTWFAKGGAEIGAQLSGQYSSGTDVEEVEKVHPNTTSVTGTVGCTMGNTHMHEMDSFNFSYLHAKKNFYSDRRDSNRTHLRLNNRRPRCRRIKADELEPDKMYQRHFRRSQPVVLEGAWAQFVQEVVKPTWTQEWLEERWGNVTVGVDYSPDLRFQHIERWRGKGYKYIAPSQEKMRFDEFLKKFAKQTEQMDAHRSSTAGTNTNTGTNTRNKQNKQSEQHSSSGGGTVELKEYISLVQTPFTEAQLGEALPPLPAVAKMLEKDLHSANLWLSADGKVSELHYDSYDNILATLSGTKTMYLIDPIYLESLYPSEMQYVMQRREGNGKYTKRPLKQVVRHFSPVNILEPNLKRFPKFEKIVQENLMMECVLRPGDLLLLPSLWWHQVHNHATPADEGRNIAVNFWYRGHSLVGRLMSTVMDNAIIDWYNQGEACDAYFDSREK